MDIKKLLEELYAIDPSLRAREAELKPVVAKLLADKPEVHLDHTFLEQLKQTLLTKPFRMSEPTKTMWPRLALFAGGFAVLAIVVTVTRNPSMSVQSSTVRSLSANAFGSLNGPTSPGSQSSSETVASPAPTALRAGGGAPMMAAATDAAVTNVGYAVGGSTGSVGKMMIAPAPYVQYKLVYKGEPLTLGDETVKVYRRVQPTSGQTKLAGALGAIRFGGLDLGSFGSADVTSFELVDGSDEGYIINVNVRDGVININQNWQTWYPCANGICPERAPLSASDVPSNEKLVDIANAFLQKHGLDTAVYGKPEVENTNYGRPMPMTKELSVVSSPAYINDSVVVMYPVKVDNQEAVDTGGTKTGLRVTIDLRKQKVSSVWPIQDSQFESSAYAAVTDAKSVIAIAERNGYWYNDPAAKVKEISLGTPTRVLVQHYVYNGMTSLELYVPALAFPVMNAPEGYYQKTIIVPLAKELLEQQYGGGVPTPMRAL